MKAHAGIFLLTLALASAAPLLPRPALPGAAGGAVFPGWPTEFDGVKLERMAPGREDAWFTRDFPGKVARFAADGRQVVLRWVNAPTRRLHPASHCFAGAGYTIEPLPMAVGGDGSLMSCFSARKPGEALRVCEQLRGAGTESWPDISSWYWHAVAAPSGSSWWSYVLVEREDQAIGMTTGL